MSSRRPTFAASPPHHKCTTRRRSHTFFCSTSADHTRTPVVSPPAPRRKGLLCNAALAALEQIYTTRNALPQTGGCAHLLGRLSSESRSAALEQLSAALGGTARTATLHLSVTDAVLEHLLKLQIRRRDEIVLGLYDDPAFTAPLRAHVIAHGGTVRWVTPSNDGTYTFRELVTAIGSRTRLVALQIVSPLLGRAESPDGALAQALRFARGAGVSTALDVTHALPAQPVHADELPVDVVVCGAAGVRGHPGAAVALWRGGRVDEVSDESAACGQSGTAAAAAFAVAAMDSHDGAWATASDSCAQAMCDALRRVEGVEVVGGLKEKRVIPVMSMRVVGRCAKKVAAALWERCPEGAAAAKLRVLAEFEEGRGKRKAHRPPLLCVEFSSVVHDASDVVRFVEIIGEEMSKVA